MLRAAARAATMRLTRSTLHRPVWASASPPPLAAAAAAADRRRPPSALPTGAFAALPVVPPGDEHLSVSLRKASRVRADPKIRNEAARARHAAARRLDALAQALCTPLGAWGRAFPAVDRLHPFEAALLTLTLGDGRYEKTLARLDAARRAALQAGKDAAAAAAKTRGKADAVAAEEAGVAAVSAAWGRGGAAALDSLKDVAKALRRLPTVDAGAPTLALVGAPNVGKSSLVAALSTGEPAVADYPFTTRSVKMGHFYVDGASHQVTDTPGLLARKDADRNDMERLTLACVTHLPTVVLYVADATGLCGASPADQWAVRTALKEAAGPGAVWVDALSKADLLVDDGMLEAGWEGRGRGVGGASPPSTRVETGADLVAALGPAAVPVCSPTGEGLDVLKEAVLAAFREQARRMEAEAAASEAEEGQADAP
jgi:nucleolar GTP-binding protein